MKVKTTNVLKTIVYLFWLTAGLGWYYVIYNNDNIPVVLVVFICVMFGVTTNVLICYGFKVFERNRREIKG